MATVELPLDKQGGRIRDMFARVAPRYDLLNRLLSLSLDRVWRRRLASSLTLPAGARLLDLCSGTGDQAEALRQRGYHVAAADFCLPMLSRSRPKFARGASPHPAPLQADALRLPFRDGSFDGATVSFGLRNVADLDRALTEIARVVRAGGELGVLEFTVPRWQPIRALYLLYFLKLLPAIGRAVSGDAGAYSYLPESVLRFPQNAEFARCLERHGFAATSSEGLSGGILALYRARRSG